MRFLRWSGGLLAGVIAVNVCEAQPQGPALTLQSHPRVADRYTRLLRRQLTDTNVTAVQQELICERSRLYWVLGDMESDLRARAAEDTAFRTPAERAARRRILDGFHLMSFEVGGPLCNALNAIANREDPIAPVDRAVRRRPD